jgi:ADP-ribose pyrophosphatase YjhB (NUDIX family)
LSPEETWQEAAVREVHEETGFQVEVQRLVGEYSQPQMPNGGELKYVCTARVIGGQPIQRGPETLQVGWFDVKSLPFSLTRFMRVYIQDAQVEHRHFVRRTLLMPRWQAVAIKGLLKLRNLRNRLLRREKS